MGFIVRFRLFVKSAEIFWRIENRLQTTQCDSFVARRECIGKACKKQVIDKIKWLTKS
jgi:triphosphoribosyl-dephospho-CoA synthetase